MTTVNQFLPFATNVGAYVRNYATWLASSLRGTGYPPNALQKEDLNTPIRQGAFVAAALSQFIMHQASVDVLDDGDLDEYEAKLVLAIQALLATGTGSKVYIGTAQTLIAGFYMIDTSAGSYNLTLPTVTGASRSILQLEDYKATWDVHPPTLLRNGATIEGVADNLILDVRDTCFTLAYDGATWRLK